MSVNFLSDLIPANQLVIRPDHPLLLRAPDALVGGSENLCAVFEPHSIEVKNPAHLVTRLISARLALPRFTRTVLILRRGQESRFSALENEFGLTTDRSDQSLRRFLIAAKEFGNSRPMEPDIQVSAGKTFDFSMEVANFAYRLDRVSRASGREVQPISKETSSHRRLSMGPFHYDPRNRVAIEGVEASILSARSRSNLTRQVNAAVAGHLLETYQLDQGVPYPKAFKFTQMAVVLEASEILSIRSKEVYAAAFLGTALISTKDLAVVLETASHYAGLILAPQHRIG